MLKLDSIHNCLRIQKQDFITRTVFCETRYRENRINESSFIYQTISQCINNSCNQTNNILKYLLQPDSTSSLPQEKKQADKMNKRFR